MKYWLFNRDPFIGLLQSIYNWVVFHPPVYPKQPGFFHCSSESTHQMQPFDITYSESSAMCSMRGLADSFNIPKNPDLSL